MVLETRLVMHGRKHGTFSMSDKVSLWFFFLLPFRCLVQEGAGVLVVGLRWEVSPTVGGDGMSVAEG